MSRILSEVPISEIQIGDRVISALRTPGKVVEIIPKCLATQSEDNQIRIKWFNGRESLVWHFWLDKVTYCGQRNINGKG